MSYADAGPVPRRCPCGCYPEIAEEGSRVQVSCSCCGRKTFRHEAAKRCADETARQFLLVAPIEMGLRADGRAL